MQIEATGKLEDVTYAVRATVRNANRQRRFRDLFGTGNVKLSEMDFDQKAKADYCYVAAHVSEIAGIDWQPPTENVSKKDLLTNFEQYLDAIPPKLENALVVAISGLYAPVSDSVEKPDGDLTEDEEADPNSSSGAENTKTAS